MTSIQLLWLLFFFELPAVILLMSSRWRIVNRMGALVICYLSGLALGVSGIMPIDIIPIQHQAAIGTFYMTLSLMIISFTGNRSRSTTPPFSLIQLLMISGAVLLLSLLLWLAIRGLLGREASALGGAMIGVIFGGGAQILTIGRWTSLPAEGIAALITGERLIFGFLLILLLTWIPRLLPREVKTDLRSPARSSSRKSPGRSGNPARRASTKGAARHEVPVRQWDDLDLRGFKRTDLLPTVVVLSLAALITCAALVVNALVTGPAGSLLALGIVAAVSFLAAIPKQISKAPFSFPIGYFFLMAHTLILTSLIDLSALTGFGWTIFVYLVLLISAVALLIFLITAKMQLQPQVRASLTISILLSPAAVPTCRSFVTDREILRSIMLLAVAGWILAEVVGSGFYLLAGIL